MSASITTRIQVCWMRILTWNRKPLDRAICLNLPLEAREFPFIMSMPVDRSHAVVFARTNPIPVFRVKNSETILYFEYRSKFLHFNYTCTYVEFKYLQLGTSGLPYPG